MFSERRINVIVMKQGSVPTIKSALKCKQYSSAVYLQNNRVSIPFSVSERLNNEPINHQNGISYVIELYFYTDDKKVENNDHFPQKIMDINSFERLQGIKLRIAKKIPSTKHST